MNKLSRICTMIGTSIIALGSLQSCVDNDYDLDKDMNLVMNVGGGQLSVPGSSTALFSLEKLLDLDEGSSIKAADQELANKYGLALGDYVLIQSGDPAEADFKIDKVNLNVNGTQQHQNVQFPTFPAALVGQVGKLSISFGGTDTGDQWNPTLNEFNNSITVHEPDVSHDIVEISSVETDIDITAKVDFNTNNTYSGAITVNSGFKIAFGGMTGNTPDFEISLNANIPGCQITDNHIIEFTQDYILPGHELLLPLHISKINCSDALNPNTHNFDFASNIVTTGKISINEPAAGEAVRMDIDVTVGDAKGGTIHGDIIAVSGIVNPTINIDPVNFEINDIPDFLKEDCTLDIENPQIYLTVNNSSNAIVDAYVTLEGEYDPTITFPEGKPVVHQTITINPGVNMICICRKAQGVAAGYTPIANSTIGELISKIPNRINVDIQANVEQTTTRFELGHNYTFKAENEVVAPLAFGNNLNFTYSDTEDGWDSDLGKYDFKEVHIEAVVTNSAPLNFEMKVDPIFIDGNSNHKVEVTVKEGKIAAGTIENPTNSQITIILKGSEKPMISSDSQSSLNGLDGIEYKLVTDNSNEVAGIPINEKQGMKFSQIRARIIGGVTVDANEL